MKVHEIYGVTEYAGTLTRVQGLSSIHERVWRSGTILTPHSIILEIPEYKKIAGSRRFPYTYRERHNGLSELLD
jgi:hypothetical protein